MKRNKLVKLLYRIGIGLTIIQSFLFSVGLPNVDKEITTIIIGVLGILASMVTTYYQYVSKHIPNKISYTGLTTLILATLAGLNEIFKIVPIPSGIGIYITYFLSLSTFAIQFLSNKKYVPNGL